MTPIDRPDHLIDFITGEPKADTGSEANRQLMERVLVEQKGYSRDDIEVDIGIVLDLGADRYRSKLDLVVTVNGRRFMVIKCAPGSLDSREREVIAAARLLDSYQIPLAAATDGRTAIVWDSVTAQCLGKGMDAIPSKPQAVETFDPSRLVPLDEKRRSRQQLIFKSYDSMNINKG
jgi:hypothetical protein